MDAEVFFLHHLTGRDRLVHVMVHAEEAAVPMDESGTVAFVRLIKPPGVTDHLNP
jgi:hypothetical protein